MVNTPLELTTDVLVVGAGAAGMMAARAASDGGASVVLLDKSIIGRGGATVLAQMTVAAALGEAEPDTPEIHFSDTMTGSRGMANPEIVRLVVEAAPADVRRLEKYGVDWARTLVILGIESVDAASTTGTLHVLLKYRQDIERAAKELLAADA